MVEKKGDAEKALMRMVEILRYLYEGRVLSVKELAKEFNVCTKTIQRDFNNYLIRFPIEKSGHGWKMREGFCVTKSDDISDKLVLDVLEKMSENLGNSFSARAKRLLSKIKNNDQSPIYARLNIEDIGEKMVEVHKVEEAILHQRAITFNYTKDNHTHSVSAKPLKIVNFDGYWYVAALDGQTHVLKKYHLKSMGKVCVDDETFKRPKALEEKLENAINVWFDADKEPFEVLLHVSPCVAKYFVRKPLSKSQRIVESGEDGSIFVSLYITHEMELLPTIMEFLPNIRVCSPDGFAKAVRERLEGYLKEEAWIGGCDCRVLE